MKTLFTTIILILSSTTLIAQSSINQEDFKLLNNTRWEGVLTYKDYSSGKQESIPTKLQIIIKNNRIKSSIQYDYEPNKNYNETVKIKENGTYYGNEKVIKNMLDKGQRTIITRYNGTDNGKEAIFFNTHIFDSENYTITKEVQLIETKERFVRNKYTFKKV